MSTCTSATTEPSDRERLAPEALSYLSPPQGGFAGANLGSALGIRLPQITKALKAGFTSLPFRSIVKLCLNG